MVADNSDEGLSAADGTSRRPPPTIDLDPSEVSDDTAKATAARATLGERWRRLRVRIKPSLVQQSGIVIGVICIALLILVASWASDWINTAGLPAKPDATARAALDDITARLARLETQTKAAPASDSSAQLSAVQTEVKNLSSNVTELQRKLDAAASALDQVKSQSRSGSIDLAPLNARLARLEQAANAPQGDAPGADVALRRALVAQALDDAARRGEPFVEVLAVAKKLSNDTSALAPLEAFAASGVPNDMALAHALLALLPQAASRPAEQPAQVSGGSLVDRLTASASRLVHIQRVDSAGGSVTGDSTSASARIEAAARLGNIAQARREIEALPDSERAVEKPWLESVERRDAALEASRRFAVSSLSALADDPASASSPNTPAQ